MREHHLKLEQGGVVVAEVWCTDRDDGLREIMHYAMMYGQDGPCTIKGITPDDFGPAIRCYMDGIDWQHHLGSDANGTQLYPSVAALHAHQPHIKTGGCGVVEVEVRIVRWVEEQNLDKDQAI